jgi:signal peptidase I
LDTPETNSAPTIAPVPAEKRPSRTFRFLVDVLETLLLSAILFLVINAVSERIKVDGFSMEPTLHDGEFVIVNKLAYRLGTFRRGDVVVFRFPDNPEFEYIKRVIGLPDDRIEIANGQISVNGQALEEPYIQGNTNQPGMWTVPASHLFVLGDNRNNSSDSRSWGPVPVDYIVGKAIFVYWPLKKLGVIPQYQLEVTAYP